MKKALSAFFIVITLSLGLVLIAYHLSPKPELKRYIPYSTAFTDNQHKLLRLSLASDDRYRLWVPLSEISKNLSEAIILYEDQSFYNNIGVDFAALFRAFWATYIIKQRRIGASTITMQVARLHWNMRSQTIQGKIQQIIRALQLNKHYSKQEILEFYLNLAPFGRNIEGIGAASLIYFNKKPNELNTIEALSLAIIPQNPNRRNPTTIKGKKYLVQARNILYQRWVKMHPEHKAYKKYLDLDLNIRPPEKLPFKALHFINYLKQKISPWQTGWVRSSLDSNIQQTVNNILQNYVKNKQPLGIKNAAALVLNYKTMQIEAMIGSADFFNIDIQGQVNGTMAKRSPGSTLKPFVYALALDEGLIHPRSLLKDSPVRYGGFTPENYDQVFLGPISARNALIKSRNVPAVNLLAKLKSRNFHKFLTKAGVSKLKDEDHYGLSLALGSGETTMLELASLYATLANQGLQKPIISYQGENVASKNKLLSAEASFLILDILKDHKAPEPFENSYNNPKRNDVAWKTGTSWAFRDAWSIGISGSYVVLVWVGNFDGKGNNNFIGRTAAGPLLFSIFEAINSQQSWRVDQTTNITQLNLKKLSICDKTGDLDNKLCPTASFSWFIPGVSPIKTTQIYRQIPINKTSGLRTCTLQKGVSELKTYEFWPSDFINIFKHAGIALKSPPKFEKECTLDKTSNQGIAPKITSPQSSLKYIINPNHKKSNYIALKATVEPDVKHIHWFINHHYEATYPSNEAYLWRAEIGDFALRAVDDAGRGDSVTFSVRSFQ